MSSSDIQKVIDVCRINGDCRDYLIEEFIEKFDANFSIDDFRETYLTDISDSFVLNKDRTKYDSKDCRRHLSNLEEIIAITNKIAEKHNVDVNDVFISKIHIVSYVTEVDYKILNVKESELDMEVYRRLYRFVFQSMESNELFMSQQ